MAVIITEKDIPSLIESGDAFLLKCAYNALDVCTPRECSDVLEPRLDEDTARIYGFEHYCQGPALTMTLRGVLIDQNARDAAIEAYDEEEETAAAELTIRARDVWDVLEPRVGKCTDPYTGNSYRQHLWPRGTPHEEAHCKRCEIGRLKLAPINPNSSSQLCRLFYTLWKAPKHHDRETGRLTVNKEALEEIRGWATKHHRPDVALGANAALRGKSANKQNGYLRSKLGADGRMRSAATVGAAETGRWSASKAPDWSGWNITQLADRIRHIIIADPGLEIGYADLEQAESYIVAYDSGDEGYIKAHKTGDVHTYVCRLMWPQLAWTGDLREDRKLADIPPDFDPFHSRRDFGKRFQHGGNMGRSPGGVARQLHISVAEAEQAYGRMYGGWGHEGAFPGIKLRHQQLWAEIQRTGITISCLGRKRQFLGRTWTAETLREALGQLEQSPVADILNIAVCRVWKDLDTYVNIWDNPKPDQPNRVWLLAQVHDAILFLFRRNDIDALREVKKRMEIPLLINGRMLTIPVEIATGPNWSHAALKKVTI